MRGGCSGNHRVGLGNTAVADHRRTLLDDAGLSSGNIGQGRPQLLGVVQPQSGDHSTFRRVDDVGGVQSAAKPHFQHHDIAVLLRKIEHPQGGDQLKLGGHICHAVGSGADALHKRYQVLVWDGLAVDLDTLIKAVDERGGEHPHPVSGGLQAGRQHGDCAALAVGARYMNEPELLVGVAQGSQQGAGTGQAGFMSYPLNGVRCRPKQRYNP